MDKKLAKSKVIDNYMFFLGISERQAIRMWLMHRDKDERVNC